MLAAGAPGQSGGMTTSLDFESPVRLKAVAAENQPTVTPALEELYRGFEKELLIPLWTEIGDLMPVHPRSKAVPHRWRWDALRALAARAGELVPVGRGGERRAIALANPGLDGRPFATPTLWAAIQYLMPGENAPEHRHTQHAFRFVLEGEGVWTVVGGDPVAMRRGDFLPQAGWNWHAHHNASTQPMAWIDGLDIPLQYITEAQFFEFGRDEISAAEEDHARALPRPSACGATRASRRSRRPPGRPRRARRCSPTAGSTPTARWPTSSRWRRRATRRTVEHGHAAVRYTDPATGGDVLPTIRVEFHRVAAERRDRRRSARPDRPSTPSSTARAPSPWATRPGRSAAATCSSCPSWQPFSARSEAGATDSDSGALDLFRFSDSPVFEALKLNRRARKQARKRRPVRQPDVIVVGGGIGGLSAAFALARKGLNVRVLERSASSARSAPASSSRRTAPASSTPTACSRRPKGSACCRGAWS